MCKGQPVLGSETSSSNERSSTLRFKNISRYREITNSERCQQRVELELYRALVLLELELYRALVLLELELYVEL